MIGDNLSSHLSLNVIKLCQEYGILFVLLPPNSTHLCQPLDVAFFRPLKAAWRRVLDDWKKNNKGVVQKSEFPRLLKETFEKIEISSKSNVISGFKKTGIFPFCPNKVISLIPEANLADDSNSGEASWTSSFELQLKQARNDKTTNATPHRGKRLALKPGKGIVVRNFDESDKESEASEGTDTVSSSTLSDTDEEEHNTSEDREKREEKEKANDGLKENEFAIVEFPTKKRKQFFIGRIDKLEADTCDMTV